MKKYNTPHRRRVIKTRLTEEEYAEFSERVTLCKMSQSQAPFPKPQIPHIQGYQTRQGGISWSSL